MTSISYHHTVNDLQGLSFAGKGPFARPEWFGLLERAEANPLFALARDGTGVVTLPLAERGRELVALSNWYAFTWQDLASEGAAREALLTRLARDLAGRAGRVVLDKVPGEDGVAARLATAFRAAGWWVACEPADSNHILDVAGRSYDEYLGARPGPLRTTLKRKSRQVDCEIVSHFDAAAWAAYEAVYSESWKPAEGEPALLRAFAEAEAAAGHLRLGIARHADEAVAAQMWTVEDGVAYIHKLAHRESATRLSAGTVLSAALFAHAIDRDRVRQVDFGTGDNAYKRDWMESVRPRYRLTCLRPRRVRNWPAMGIALLRQLVSRGRPF